MLNFSVLLQALFFVFGLVWCCQILKRLPQDVAEFCAGSGTERTVITMFWGVTAIVGVCMADFVIGLMPPAAI